MVASRTFVSVASLALALAATAPARAQADPAPAPEDSEIVVIAERMRGQVDTPQPPVAVLDEEEIATYGAGSLVELVAQLAPQTTSSSGRGGGRPAFLVNGQRINGFRELRNYPPEAIRRVEILPEEVAVRFGFQPSQRVVNFILKDNFASLTTEVDFAWPSGGGYSTNEQEASLLRIDGPNRLNLAVELDDGSMLTEAERGVSSLEAVPLPGDADPAAYRSLVADSRDIRLNANWTRGLGQDGLGGSITLSATASRADSLSLRGIDAVTLTDAGGNSAWRTLYAPSLGFDARIRDTRTESFELGAGYHSRIGDWQVDATANWAHEESRTLTDDGADTAALQAAVLAGDVAYDAPVETLLSGGLVVPGERFRAGSNTEDIATLATLTGRPAMLPAGELALVLKAGFDWDHIDSTDTRNPDVRTRLKRGDASAGFTVGLPIASRRTGAWGAIGDLSLDLSGGVHRLSAFGTLYDGSAGLTWGVTRNLDLQASFIHREAAPTLAQLGAPQVLTAGATVYDFATGRTVLVDVLSGGNPDLVAERQSDWKFALNWDLPVLDRSRFIAEYYDETSRNVSSSFPVLTPSIEAAFPGRVVRDGAGELVSIDQRPVTFAREESRRVRYGIDVSDRIAGKDEPARGERGERRGRGGPGAMLPGQRRGGRWSLALYHAIRLQDDVLIADSGPLLDLLDGDALSGSPRPRHELDLSGGLYWNGMGMRLSGNYFGGSAIEGSGPGSDTTLDFHPYATFDVRAFVDLERKFDKVAFLKGSRFSVRIDNLFDAQQRVTDADGIVPISYRPDFVDPAGRFVEIEFRKRF